MRSLSPATGAPAARRPRRRPRERAVGLGAAALAALALGCSPPPEGPVLELPATTDAVEARFGERFCRRIEDPGRVDDLVAFAASVRTGWQAAWKKPPPPQVAVDFYRGDQRTLRLGLGDGQLFTTLQDRAYFQPLDQRTAADLIARLGGAPTAAPELPCRG